MYDFTCGLRSALANALNKRGRAIERRGKLSVARRCYVLALAIDPTSFLAKYNLAFVAWLRGNLDGAWEGFHALVMSNAPGSCRADCLLRLGHISDQRGEYEEAFGYYAAVLTVVMDDASPQDRDRILADAYCCMAYIEYYRDNVERAVQLLLEALQYDPNHAGSFAYLGLCYLHKGRTQDAVTAGRKAVEFEPERANWWSILEEIYTAVGNAQGAKECHEQAQRRGD